MMGLAGLLGTVELKSRGSVCLWPVVPPEPGDFCRASFAWRGCPGPLGPCCAPQCNWKWLDMRQSRQASSEVPDIFCA